MPDSANRPNSSLADAEKEDANERKSLSAIPSFVPNPPRQQNIEVIAKRVENENEDPNMVFWGDPHDLENPKNWPDSWKWWNITIISIITLIT